MNSKEDIVTRLRENADLDAMEHCNPIVIAMEREAADEIERLREALTSLQPAQEPGGIRNLQRYEVRPDVYGNTYGHEEPSGEWVKYADVAALSSREQIRNEALEEAEEAVTTLYEQAEPPYLVEICGAIRSLQSKDGKDGAGDAEDARRYRWLCNVATESQWIEFGGYTIKMHVDAAVDAAIAQKGADK
jgi:hypothetical protein